MKGSRVRHHDQLVSNRVMSELLGRVASKLHPTDPDPVRAYFRATMDWQYKTEAQRIAQSAGARNQREMRDRGGW